MNVPNFFQKRIYSRLSALNSRLNRGLIVALAIGTAVGCPDRASAQMTQQELDPNGVTVVASPYQGGEKHQLLILEQLTNARACWSEQKNQTMTIINPLLADFDFSGICGRATDSNGFSVRMGGRDFDWRYTMQVIDKNGDLILMARNTTGNAANPDLVVGRVGGRTPGFAKIILEPGWRVTRRVAQGKLTGHFYLTHDRTIEQVAAEMQGVPKAAAVTVTPMGAPTMPGVSGGAIPVGTELMSVPPAAPTVIQNVPPSPEVLK